MSSQSPRLESLLPQTPAATTASFSELEHCRFNILSNTKCIAFNEKKSVNQLKYCHNQGGLNVVPEDFQY